MRVKKKIKLRERSTAFLKNRLNYLEKKWKDVRHKHIVTNEMRHIKYHLKKRKPVLKRIKSS
jgi:hypothetical protein